MLPAEPGVAALFWLLMSEELGLVLLGFELVAELELLLGLVLLVVPCPAAEPAAALPAIEVSLCGVVLVEELVEGLVEVDDVWSVGGVVLLEGDVLDGLVEQLEETRLALSTLMVSPLAVPVTETVWPTWSLKAALFLDCIFQALPLLSVRV